MENLRCLDHAPGIAMHEVPPDFYMPEEDEDADDPDMRLSR